MHSPLQDMRGIPQKLELYSGISEIQILTDVITDQITPVQVTAAKNMKILPQNMFRGMLN